MIVTFACVHGVGSPSFNDRFCVAFKRLFAAYSKMKFNKLHVWQHIGDMIREWGMVWNYWMEAAELAHKLLLKNLLRE